MFGMFRFATAASSGSAAPPTVISINRTTWNQGESYGAFTITGTGFATADPTGAVSLGAGINIDTYMVDSDTQITVNSSSVDLTATLGTRDVTVTTPIGSGSLVGGVTVAFSFGNALQFDGVNDLASFTQTPSMSTFSISLWVKNNGVFDRMLFGGATAHINYITNAAIRVVPLSGNRQYVLPVLPTNTWTHIIITSDNFVCRVYRDGVESTSGAQTLASTVNLNRIGSWNNGFFLNGVFNEVAIWSGYVLTGAEITALWNSGNGQSARAAVATTPYAYWRLNGVSGNSTNADDSGNGRTLTLTNFNTATCWVAH
jgi:hypothetical protein